MSRRDGVHARVAGVERAAQMRIGVQGGAEVRARCVQVTVHKRLQERQDRLRRSLTLGILRERH